MTAPLQRSSSTESFFGHGLPSSRIEVTITNASLIIHDTLAQENSSPKRRIRGQIHTDLTKFNKLETSFCSDDAEYNPSSPEKKISSGEQRPKIEAIKNKINDDLSRLFPRNGYESE